MFFLLWIKINYLTAMAKGIEAVVLPDRRADRDVDRDRLWR